MKTLEQLNVADKIVLVRVDFNVPLKDGAVADDTRIRAHLPTIHYLLSQSAKVVLMSHLGRPGGKPEPKYSLRPTAHRLEELLELPVAFAEDCIGPKAQNAVDALPKGRVLVLENLRYHNGEEANDQAFAATLANLGDVYVNDAFATAHRAHASTAGIAALMDEKGMGKLMESEIEALDGVLKHPKEPVMMIIGGAKVSSKLAMLEFLLPTADEMLIGGAMANTFLAALGHNMGRSLYETDYIPAARDILTKAASRGCAIHLPVDLVAATELTADAPHKICAASALPHDHMALDVGPATTQQWAKHIARAGTILWNGPVGAFEIKPFDRGTIAVAKAVGASKAFSLAGGGDTIAALEAAGQTRHIGYVSTGGGALLEFLEGRTLPGIAALG